MPVTDAETKTQRLLALQMLFWRNPRRGFRTTEIAAHLGVTERTARNYVDELSVSGRLPIVKRGWEWRLMEGARMELLPVNLDLEEGAQLHLAARLLARHSDEPHPAIRPDLPEGVERVILRAMAKDPSDRFQTAAEMASVLDAAVQSSQAVDEPRQGLARLRREHPPIERYNIAAVRQLLVAVFTPQTLRRFSQDRSDFRRIVDDFGPGQGLNDMVDRVVDYCQKRDLWNEFLADVQREYPKQYARFESDLHGGSAQLPRRHGA